MEQNKPSPTLVKKEGAETRVGETDPELKVDDSPLNLERKKLDLEFEKLKLERFKAWLTAGSVVVPLLSAMLTFLLTGYNETRQKEIDMMNLERQYEERAITSRLELLKYLVEKPDRKQEILRTWKQVFPKDYWVDGINLEDK